MKNTIGYKDYIYAALFAAVTAVMGYISIPLPFSPVPITGQSLAIMLAGSILTTRQAALSITTFLLLGIVGVPVFAGGSAGIGSLLGPRGGYLIGFLVGAVIITLIRGKSNQILRIGVANIIGGIIVIYVIGVVWLSFMTKMDLIKAITVGALPYIPGDIFKAFIATMASVPVNRQIQRQLTL